MTEIFSDYSEYYDLLYEDKPYRAEAEYIARLIARFSSCEARPERILDLACGTGRHCLELAALGYVVEGSDASARMITRAERAACEQGASIRFYNHSFQESQRIGKTYDVVVSLFSSIGYLTTHSEIMTSLRNINSLLVPQGLLIFDFWNGNAVMKDYAPVKVLQKSKADHELIRISRTSLDIEQQLAKIDFQFICLENGAKQHEFTEQHIVRYFFFKEMEAYLDTCGFNMLYKTRFMGDTCNPDDWNITIVARKR